MPDALLLEVDAAGATAAMQLLNKCVRVCLRF